MKKLVSILFLFMCSNCLASDRPYVFEASDGQGFDQISVSALGGENQFVNVSLKSGKALYDGSFYCMAEADHTYQCAGDDDSGTFSITLGEKFPTLMIDFICLGEPDSESFSFAPEEPLSLKGRY